MPATVPERHLAPPIPEITTAPPAPEPTATQERELEQDTPASSVTASGRLSAAQSSAFPRVVGSDPISDPRLDLDAGDEDAQPASSNPNTTSVVRYGDDNGPTLTPTHNPQPRDSPRTHTADRTRRSDPAIGSGGSSTSRSRTASSQTTRHTLICRGACRTDLPQVGHLAESAYGSATPSPTAGGCGSAIGRDADFGVNSAA